MAPILLPRKGVILVCYLTDSYIHSFRNLKHHNLSEFMRLVGLVDIDRPTVATSTARAFEAIRLIDVDAPDGYYFAKTCVGLGQLLSRCYSDLRGLNVLEVECALLGESLAIKDTLRRRNIKYVVSAARALRLYVKSQYSLSEPVRNGKLRNIGKLLALSHALRLADLKTATITADRLLSIRGTDDTQ